MARAIVGMPMVFLDLIAPFLFGVDVVMGNGITAALLRALFRMGISSCGILMIMIFIPDGAGEFLHADHQFLIDVQNGVPDLGEGRVLFRRHAFCEQCGRQTLLSITHRCKNLVQILGKAVPKLRQIFLQGIVVLS